MKSRAGRVIVLARRLDGRLLLARLGRRERLLEAAHRRAESASCFWQSLGAEHDQRDGENQEQVCGAEDVLDHLWSLWFGPIGPLWIRLGARSSGARDYALSALRPALDAGLATDEGPASAAPRPRSHLTANVCRPKKGIARPSLLTDAERRPQPRRAP